MANILETLVVKIAGEADDYEKTLKESSDKTEGWAKGLGSKVGDLAGGAILGGVGLAAGAITGIGVAAFNVANDVSTAAKTMQSQFGFTADKAQALADVGLQVFGNNFAGSVEEAAAAVGTVQQQLGSLAGADEIQGITENAFRLRDAFGVDVTEGVSAVKTLMEQFGIESSTAFDLVATGFQSGLDRSGDFLDTINEYSTQFASGGASAEQFFGLLDSGLAGGALGTDKAADAFKEFRVRIADGSKTTAEALSAIGLSTEDITAGMSSGALSAADAFNMVMTALQTTQDPVVQMNAGVGLLGTQFEDLGQNIALGLDLTEDWADGSEEAILKVDAQYNTFGQMLEGFKRTAIVALEPLGEMLLDLANSVMPTVTAAAKVFADALTSIANIVQLLISGDFTGGIFGLAEDDPIIDFLFKLRDAFMAIPDVVKKVADFFNDHLGAALNKNGALFERISTKVQEIMPIIQEVIEKALTAIGEFWTAHGETIMKVVGNTFEVIGTIISTTIDVILGAVKLFFQILNGDWSGAADTLKGIVQSLWDGIVSIFTLQTSSLKTIFSDIWPGMQQAWSGFASSFQSGMQSTFSNVQSGWQGFSTEMVNLSAGMWQQIQWGTQTGIDASKGFVTAGVQFMQGDWQGGLQTLQSTGEGIWQSIYSQFQTQIDAITGIFEGVDWLGLGTAIVQGIADGINNSLSWIEDAAQQAAQSALDAAKSWLGIGSPSRVAALELGRPFTQGMSIGAEQGIPKATDRIQSALNRMTSDLTLASPQVGAGGTGAAITINIYAGDRDTANQARLGILDGLRQAGLA